MSWLLACAVRARCENCGNRWLPSNGKEFDESTWMPSSNEYLSIKLVVWPWAHHYFQPVLLKFQFELLGGIVIKVWYSLCSDCNMWIWLEHLFLWFRQVWRTSDPRAKYNSPGLSMWSLRPYLGNAPSPQACSEPLWSAFAWLECVL